MQLRTGGCLCHAVRYEATAQPVRITYCHCRFCQRATGAPYLFEPIFDSAAFAFSKGVPKVYDHRSTGSGLLVHVHFCDICGTKLAYTFERFAGVTGVLGGTFDDPSWITATPGNAKHIFTETALPGTVLPAGIPCFSQHATSGDGAPETPRIHSAPFPVGGRT